MPIPIPSSVNNPIAPSSWIKQDASGNAAAIITPADAQTLAALIGEVIQQLPLVFNGATVDLAREPKVIKSVNLTAATAETTIWTPTSGKKFRLLRGVITTSAQSILTFKDNTAGTTILTLELAANTPFTFNLGTLGILSAAANNLLTVTRATSATLTGFVSGCEE